MTEHCAECFTAPMRPNVLSEDHISSQVPDHAAQGAVNLAYVHPVRHDMEVTTASAFLDQWQNAFFATAFPCSLPAPLGGPDFRGKERPRRWEDAPRFDPLHWLQGLTRRIESSIRNSWDLVPGIRRVVCKYLAVTGSHLKHSVKQDRGSLDTVSDVDWIKAGRDLYKKLTSGHYTDRHGNKKPIDFQTNKLPFAVGLTEPERILL